MRWFICQDLKFTVCGEIPASFIVLHDQIFVKHELFGERHVAILVTVATLIISW